MCVKLSYFRTVELLFSTLINYGVEILNWYDSIFILFYMI